MTTSKPTAAAAGPTIECEECKFEGGAIRPAFARLHVPLSDGMTGDLCMAHLRSLIELMRFLAAEGPQAQEDIEAQLTKLSEEYPWPDKAVEQ